MAEFVTMIFTVETRTGKFHRHSYRLYDYFSSARCCNKTRKIFSFTLIILIEVEGNVSFCGFYEGMLCATQVRVVVN